MKKTDIARILRILICLGIILGGFYLYLPPRENIIDTMNQTAGTGHVDVLCIGSSHMGRGLNPVQMYKDHGYAAYSLWCGSQAPWQTYYYLKETLKSQKPFLVILDVYKINVTQTDDGYNDAETVNNLLDTPLSIGKIAAVSKSSADSKLDILLRFPYIHDEYASFAGLSAKKFYGRTDYSMGYEYNDEVQEFSDVIEKSGIRNVLPLSKKNEKYLRKIIDICEENAIDIILVNTPYPGLGDQGQAISNYIGQIADECNVDYIDGNMYWKEIGMDWSTDRADEHGHLNNSGVTKFTAFVEEHIYDNYDIPDRRSDREYSVYDKGVIWLEDCLRQ